MENAISIILAGCWLTREIMSFLERKELKRERSELMDRIMSVDYREYKHYSKTPAAQRANVRMSDEEMAKEELEKNKC